MDAEKATQLAREIFGSSTSHGTRWWLFENGTVVVGMAPEFDETWALDEMKALAEKLGPYEGQASQFGDFDPMPLKNHERAWLVRFPCSSAILTLVDTNDFDKKLNRPPADEVIQVGSGGYVRAQDAVGDIRAGLCGRMKRNRDARERKIIARSEEHYA